MIQLNLACGKDPVDGWINLDKNPCDDRVVQCDLLLGIPYPDDSVDKIFCSHFLEHLKLKHEAVPFLKECRRVLKPGGTLTIVVPDLQQILKHPVGIDKMSSTIFGDGRTEWDYHASGWYLKRFMDLGYTGAIQVVPESGPPIPVWDDMILLTLSSESRWFSPREITVVYQKMNHGRVDHDLFTV